MKELVPFEETQSTITQNMQYWFHRGVPVCNSCLEFVLEEPKPRSAACLHKADPALARVLLKHLSSHMLQSLVSTRKMH